MPNPAEQFIPPWAESALTKPPPVDAAELKLLREFYEKWQCLDVELAALREFYATWLHYHTIPKQKRFEAGNALLNKHKELESLLANRQ